jgi:uncharacterized protein
MKSSITGRATTWLILLAVGAVGFCGERNAKDYSPFPKPDAGYVTDLADLLSQKQEQELEKLLYLTEDRSGVEIIVMTIDSVTDYPGTPNSNIERFARALFDRYGIGNMPQNDGVLLLVARKDRKVRIELGGGYGRARDRDARRIMDKKILPSFRDDEYAKGITRGVKGLMREFGGVSWLPSWLPWLLGGIAISLIPVAISLFKNGKRGWGWIVVGLIIILLLALLFLARRAGQAVREGDLGSGGLGGFGGGFSGGGGATGSW